MSLKHHSYNILLYYIRNQISAKKTTLKTSSELQFKENVERYKLHLVTKNMFDEGGEKSIVWFPDFRTETPAHSSIIALKS